MTGVSFFFRAHGAEHRHAVDGRKPEVEKHELEGVDRELRERVPAVGYEMNCMGFIRKRRLDGVGNHRIVFNKEDAHGESRLGKRGIL